MATKFKTNQQPPRTLDLRAYSARPHRKFPNVLNLRDAQDSGSASSTEFFEFLPAHLPATMPNQLSPLPQTRKLPRLNRVLFAQLKTREILASLSLIIAVGVLGLFVAAL